MAATKLRSAKALRHLSRFVDSVRVTFRGGNGGDGCISMLHLYCNEFAGPDGGNGGNGGHVILRANPTTKSLGDLKSVYRAQSGSRGHGKELFGEDGEHTIVDVPVGTLVTLANPKHLSELDFDPDLSPVVADLDLDGSMFIAARGGAGGHGNAHYLSNKNRHPRVAQVGGKGETNIYDLRMRMYAHIGLIGLPNSGKSTLLKTLTRASVQVGDYAFTTRHPQVGVLEYDDYSQVAISDLPGLIEESHANRGLGVQFLRSVKRCACLLYVIDLADNPIRQLGVLVNELELFQKNLSKRPSIVLANKIDNPEAEKNRAEFAAFVAQILPQSKLLFGSSQRGDNLEVLRLELKRMHDDYQLKHADEDDNCLRW